MSTLAIFSLPFCAETWSIVLPCSLTLLRLKFSRSYASTYAVPKSSTYGTLTIAGSNRLLGRLASASLSLETLPCRTSAMTSSNTRTGSAFSCSAASPGAPAWADPSGADRAYVSSGVAPADAMPVCPVCMKMRICLFRSVSDARSLFVMFKIFFRWSRCSMPNVFRRSSSSKSYKNAPSTAASTKASRYCPNESVWSHRATSSTDQAETLSVSWPGIWPGLSDGLNCSPPNLSS
mmetsp:Transcript_20317/g.62595  ORF Transcript_20317/g.62595 Transcript_20317/m.62595 type:complete len:235 (-) Transcript_20317:5-709(-)